MIRCSSIGLGIALLAAACERIEPPPAPVEDLRVDFTIPAFAREDARLAVAHAGVRRLELVRPDGSREIARERIVTDGHGRFSITPVDSPDSSIADWNLYALTQRAREGFLFRYRDFLVRDTGLFARNWDCVALDSRATVAGRTCVSHRITRKEGGVPAFEVSVDEATQLVLAFRELDARGEPRASMVYESFELDPETTAVAWHVPANDERAWDPARIAGVPVVLLPRLLPRGYRFLETTTVSAGEGDRWMKTTYTDGIQPLFFFQSLATAGTRVAPASVPGADAATAGAVVVFEIGTATVLQGTVEGFDLIVIGRAPQEELFDLLESALP